MSIESNQSYRNTNWRNLSDVKPDDPDYYAYDNGILVQKRVSFNKQGEGNVSWEPLVSGEVVYCQAPSKQFLEVIEEYGDDPRSAMSASRVHRQFGGHPDERVSRDRR